VKRNIRIIQLLIDNGANVNVKDNEGNIPLNLAYIKGYKEGVECLLDGGANVNTLLHLASYDGNLEMIELLFKPKLFKSKYNIDVNIKNNTGLTSLYVASLQGHQEVVALLLANRADLSIADESGNTPIHVASSEGKLEVVKVFVNSKGKFVVNIKNSLSGKSPIHYASCNGHPEVAAFLLANGADPIVVDNFGNTPLHVASLRGDIETIKLLLKPEYNVDVNKKNNGGDTPLYWASDNGHPEVVALLLANGADPRVVDNDGNTPLHIAFSAGDIETIKLLLKSEYNVDVNKKNNDGITPLYIAFHNGHEEILNLLFQYMLREIEGIRTQGMFKLYDLYKSKESVASANKSKSTQLRETNHDDGCSKTCLLSIENQKLYDLHKVKDGVVISVKSTQLYETNHASETCILSVENNLFVDDSKFANEPVKVIENTVIADIEASPFIQKKLNLLNRGG
jgi:ankyrin repeat protein